MLSRFRVFLFLVTLVVLRLVIGFHFFAEGTAKIKGGDFSAEPFLRAATGPFQAYYHGLLDDPWAAERLGVTVSEQDGKPQVAIDPTLTLALWGDFVDRAQQHYRFGDVQWVLEQKKNSGVVGTAAGQVAVREVAVVNKASSPDRDIRELETTISMQPESAKAILAQHKQELLGWLAANRTEIVEFYSTSSRVEGFARDGQHWRETALAVDSLRSQRDAIVAARGQKSRAWKNEIDALWDSFESQINGLAVDRQTGLAPLKIHRPFQQSQSRLQWVNTLVPWFDLCVGACLILGLLTRTAALLGSGFLASVVLSQPPWIPGAAATQYQLIELAALLLIAVSVAGQIGGLDYFLSRRRTDKRVLE